MNTLFAFVLMPDTIFRNLLTSLLALATNVVVGFLLMPFIVHRIGLTGFGIWMLVNTLVGYMGLVDMGLAPTLVRKSAELMAKHDAKALNSAMSIFVVLYLLIGTIVGVTTVSLIPLMPQIFHVPEENINDFQTVFWILGLQIAVSFPMSIWNGLLGGLQAYHIQNSISIIAALIRAAGTVLLLQSGFGLISLIWLGFTLTGIGWLCAMFSVKRRIPYLHIKISSFEFGPIKDIARFSGVMFIGGVSGKILFESSRIIIGLFQPIASITIYEVGLSICNYSRNILYATSVFMPSAAHLAATGGELRLQGLYLTGTKYLFAVYSAITVVLIIIGKNLIALWMGEGFEASVWILYLLLLGNLYQSQNVVAYYLLIGMNRLREFTIVMVVYPVLNIFLSILFVVQWGLIGVAVATTTTIILVETYFLLKIVDIFETSVLSLLRICYSPAILPALAGATSIYVTRQFSKSDTWSGIALEVVLFSIAWLITFVLAGVTDEEKWKMKEKVSQLIPEWNA